jgi:hypothetical protein
MDTDTVPQNSSPKPLLAAAIALTTAVCTLAFVNWSQANNWQYAHLSLYQLFPIFGVLAFSIMWSQYMIEAAKNFLGYASAIPKYFRITSFMVLIAILMHPGLLIAQLFKDGYGLPPGSYKSYVGPSQEWIVLLGTVSLLAFLAFELKRFFGDKTWWKYIIALNDLAMIAIFYHGLRLGHTIQNNWFQAVWYMYGITLLGALAYKYYLKFNSHNRHESHRLFRAS